MKYCFLDIDGVLARKCDFNPVAQSNTLHRPCVDQLNRIIHETGAKVVLISAWRYMILTDQITLTGFAYLMRTHGCTDELEIIATTHLDETCSHCLWGKKHDESCPRCGKVSTRGDQVTAYLGYAAGCSKGRVVDRSPYVVIDNMDLGISAAGHPFVQCDENFGLTAADADRAI